MVLPMTRYESSKATQQIDNSIPLKLMESAGPANNLRNTRQLMNNLLMAAHDVGLPQVIYYQNVEISH
jgi:hypothetical protein